MALFFPWISIDLRCARAALPLEMAWNNQPDPAQLKTKGLCSESDVAICTEDGTAGCISGFGVCLQRALSKVSLVAPNFCIVWMNAGHMVINVQRGLPPLGCCKRPCINLHTPIYMINVHMHIYMLDLGKKNQESCAQAVLQQHSKLFGAVV